MLPAHLMHSFTNCLFTFRAGMALLALALAFPFGSVQAKYVVPSLMNVPVEQLIKNLEEQANKDARNAQARFNLARAHAMAYALKTDTARVAKGREDQGVWFGFDSSHVPFTVKPTDNQEQLKIAREHLAKAIQWYQEALKLSPDDLSIALGLAWCIEQSGAKQEAIRQYRQVIAAAWEKEKDWKVGRGHSVTAEGSGYLIPLLDRRKDRREIRTLQARAKHLMAMPRFITPLVIPLREGLTVCALEDRTASVTFDADGTGLKRQWTWITKDAGWLVYDPHRTGRITSALQWFGNVTFWMFWENGYQALAALDDDGNGKLTAKELAGLAVWQDRNGNGRCEPGEVKQLAEWGIVALSCAYEQDTTHPDRIVYSPQGVSFSDGTHRPTYDILLHRR